MKTFDTMFQNQVLNAFLTIQNLFPASNAFCIREKYYSYEEFSKTINGIRKLLKTESHKTSHIGIITNDDIETYASIFAVWFEGLAYVPLSPSQPKERNLDIIGQASINIVLDSSKVNTLAEIQTIKTAGLREDQRYEHIFTDDDKLAYILFTSGSTGKPKGVAITRGNIGSFMQSFMNSGFKLDNRDRCLQCFELTFDVSVQSFLVPLTVGACVYTIPPDQIKYSYVFGLLDDHKLTFGAMAPSMIRFLRPYFDEIDVPSMRYNILTAEASPVDLIDEWSKCVPNAEIFDFYGPTETTIYCTYYQYKRNSANKALNGMLSIGKPMKGVHAIIMDQNGNVLKKNQKGELCISGGQVSPGYYNNNEKNADSFFEMVISGKKERFYKTGDLCILDDDGDLLYSGRKDYQVKIQGHRIELGEIEFHGREVCNGKNCVAIVIEDKTGNNEIALFMEDKTGDPSILIDKLKKRLPHYMIPSRIICIEEFPVNASGKTDRIKLKNQIVAK